MEKKIEDVYGYEIKLYPEVLQIWEKAKKKKKFQWELFQELYVQIKKENY